MARRSPRICRCCGRTTGGPHGSLIGHVARANPHWKLFARPAESLALFWGPHAYVSPTWYTPGAKVPTWNYVTVHAYGRPQIIEDTQGALDVLATLAREYEGAGPDGWGLDRLPPGNAEAQTRGIIGFRMPLSRVETKIKLSQNREMADRAARDRQARGSPTARTPRPRPLDEARAAVGGHHASTRERRPRPCSGG